MCFLQWYYNVDNSPERADDELMMDDGGGEGGGIRRTSSFFFSASSSSFSSSFLDPIGSLDFTLLTIMCNV